jgi:ABC-type phosphate transport system substrate-binding protein
MVTSENVMSRFLAVYLAIFLLASELCQARDLAVVVNRNNTASQLTALELEKLLKPGIQNWPDGRRIEIFLTGPDSPDNRMILQRAFKLKPEEIRSLADAHRAEIRVVGSDDVVLTMVGSNPGAIGIVNVYSINSRVKVVKVDGKLPLEPGYLLHGN